MKRQAAGGLLGLQNRLTAARTGGMAVKVGLPKGSGTHGPSGMSVVALGAIHEFGTANGHIPERPFLRGTMKKRKRDINALVRAIGKSIVTKRGDPERGLKQLGAVAAGYVQEQISSSVPPPNAPSTIKRKGSSTTLVDTGALRQAITWQRYKRRGR